MHLPYIHTPLKEIGYQGLASLENNTVSADLQDRYNKVFTIPSDIQLPDRAIIREINAPEVVDLERLKSEAEKENKFYLVRIVVPFLITDKNPEIYRCLKDISPFPSTHSDVFNVADSRAQGRGSWRWNLSECCRIHITSLPP